MLDNEAEIDGVTHGTLSAGLAQIALPFGSSLNVRAGWGSVQRKDNGTRLVMPGGGNITEREWTDQGRVALMGIGLRHGLDLDTALLALRPFAVDVRINADTGWSAVPAKVWQYTTGGYQVLKKWLSYREAIVLDRSLKPEEVLHFAKTARRITKILCMGPELDAAHALARTDAIAWGADAEDLEVDIVA